MFCVARNSEDDHSLNPDLSKDMNIFKIGDDQAAPQGIDEKNCAMHKKHLTEI